MPTVNRPLDRLLSAEEPAPPGRVPWLSIARVVVISILVSELITIVLTRVLPGEVLEEGMLIALVCAGPISAWIAHREFLMRNVIEQQRSTFYFALAAAKAGGTAETVGASAAGA
jgi:hypothetical protein